MTSLKWINTTILFFALIANMGCSSSGTSKKSQGNTSVLKNTTKVSVVGEHGQLQIANGQIEDANGQPIQLRGMSLFWSQWIGKYYNAEAVQWLKNDWQCTVVRAALAVDETDGYLTNPSIEKQKVFDVIDAAIATGIYVVVDWHSHHAEDHLEAAKSFFAEVAQKYGDYPNIIYEPYNEPLNVSWSTILKPYHESVVKAIREHDPDNIIVCGTRNWSQAVDEVVGHTIEDPNVAYTLHYYAATHKKELRDIAQFALDNKVPLFVTEFGVTEASGDGSIDHIEAQNWWNFLDDNKISWCNWSIADKDELSAALKPNANSKGNWSLNDLTESGTMVRDELKLKNRKY